MRYALSSAFRLLRCTLRLIGKLGSINYIGFDEGTRPSSLEAARHRMELLPMILPVALMMLVVMAPESNAQVNRWVSNQDNALWSDGTNWSSGQPPHAFDTVKIGTPNLFKDSLVFMKEPGVAGNLDITDGMLLRNQHELDKTHLNVLGTTTISGTSESPSYLSLVRSEHTHDFKTNHLNIREHGNLWLLGGAIEVGNELRVEPLGRLSAAGKIFLQGDGNTLVNDGDLSFTKKALIEQTGDGLFDLDGTSETGRLYLLPETALTVRGISLADVFDGEITMGGESVFETELNQGWATGSGSQITFLADGEPNNPAAIRGNLLGLGGNVSVEASDEAGKFAWAAVESDASVGVEANVQIGARGFLEFNGNTDVHGGTFTMEQDGGLSFAGITTIFGGKFSTFSSDAKDGRVVLGNTVWNGNATFEGLAEQAGQAAVDGATVIHADVFDMDGRVAGIGNGAHSDWTLNDSLRISATEIDTKTGDGFFGSMTIAGSGLGQLHMEMRNPESQWEMGGQLVLRNQTPQATTRVSGSKMIASGAIEVEGSGVAIAADVDFVDGGTLKFTGEEATLELLGKTKIERDMQFLDSGDLVNRNSLQLQHGVGITKVRVVNRGAMSIGGGLGGSEIGAARLEKFINSDQGTFVADVGVDEETQLNESDLLVILSSSVLDGTLALSVTEGEEVQSYQSTTLIESPEGLSGEFSQIDGIEFRDGLGIAVTYSPHTAELTPALIGDADLNGEVAFGDFLQLSANFGNAGSWINGDFDGDGEVAFPDFLKLSGNFGKSSSAVAAVPEPSCVFLLASGFCLFAIRRRQYAH